MAAKRHRRWLHPWPVVFASDMPPLPPPVSAANAGWGQGDWAPGGWDDWVQGGGTPGGWGSGWGQASSGANGFIDLGFSDGEGVERTWVPPRAEHVGHADASDTDGPDPGPELAPNPAVPMLPPSVKPPTTLREMTPGVRQDSLDGCLDAASLSGREVPDGEPPCVAAIRSASEKYWTHCYWAQHELWVRGHSDGAGVACAWDALEALDAERTREIID
ncbi:hypothetical protein FB451DRAFT_1405850 [Mycena latifolia]|nr:hypothetical protein FB451DRAFT_1405850 [Mycena latifolia]